MANLAEFEQLVRQLMSGDTNVIRQSEEVYNNMKRNPDMLVLSLVQLGRTNADQGVRTMCAVLLRPLIVKTKDCIWTKIQPQTKKTVTTELLLALEIEPTAPVRNKLCDAISELASYIVPTGEWPELLPFMFRCTKSEHESNRESSLAIFSQLAQYMGDMFRPYFNVLKEVLAAGLKDASVKVRVAALAATANFLQALSEPTERAEFQQFLPTMLEVITVALQQRQERQALESLELFVELAEVEPTFLRPALPQVMQTMLQITQAKTLEDSTRHMALEVLITLAEARPGMVRKLPEYLPAVLPIVVNMLLTLEDTDLSEWNEEEDEDDTEITDYDVAEESLDRLALALGGKTLVPPLFGLAQQLLSTENSWLARHSGLISISLVGEGCRKFLEPHLASIMGMILPRFADSHPRVRWAACNAIGQMSTDFGPLLQNQFHAQILQALVSVMDDTANPRVQSHAASAIINFCEHCSERILVPYLDVLLGKLAALLQSGKRRVQEQAITAVAAIADCAEKNFIKYYDSFVPFLKSILINAANNKEYRMMRGKAMECISLIGVAVGKEKFAPDAKQVMEQMMKTQAGQMEADDPQIGFMHQAWARICKCLGQDFVPFLPYIMPTLLHTAGVKADVQIVDSESEANKDGWEYISVGDKSIGIHTSTLEEKSTACNMLYCYAEQLQEGFFQYVEPVSKLVVPLLKFYYHDGVRSAAVTILPHLMNSAALFFSKAGAANGADKMYLRNLFTYIFDTLVEAMQQEMEIDILAFMLESLAECIATGGEGVMNNEQQHKTITALRALLEDLSSRRDERAEKKKDHDYDDEEAENLDEEELRDEEVLTEIAEVLGQMVKQQHASFLPYFQEISQFVLQLLEPGRRPSDRQSALCILDDLVEFGGPAVRQFFPHFVQSVLSYVTDPDPAVRQAACYGVGVCAMFGAEAFTPYVPDALNRLSQIITAPDARNDVYASPTENAIAAVAKLCEHQAHVVNQAQVLPAWLNWLPVTEDKVEAKLTYALLLNFLEKNNPHIIGASFSNLPKIISIFAEVVGTDLVDAAVNQRIISFVRTVQSAVPADVLQRAWAALTPEQQANLQKSLTQ